MRGRLWTRVIVSLREREGECEFVIVHEKEIMREIEYIRSRDRQIKYT